MTHKKVCGACDQPTEVVLCNDCMRVFRSDLEQSEWLLEQLSVTMSRQAVSARTEGGRSAETPDPVHWGAAAASRTLVAALDDCALALARDLREPVHQVLPFLSDNLSRMTTWLPASGHFARIDAAVGRAINVVDIAPPKSEFRAPCDVAGCAGEWWTIPGDRDYVSCNDCGTVVSGAKVKDRLAAMLDGHLYSVSDMALVMTIRSGKNVKRDRIHALTKRTHDPLAPRARTADGIYLYSVIDVEDRLSRSK